MKKTKVFNESFGRHKMFNVYDVEPDGSKVNGEDSKPVVSFGIKKAKAILDHVEELKKFVEENDK